MIRSRLTMWLAGCIALPMLLLGSQVSPAAAEGIPSAVAKATVGSLKFQGISGWTCNVSAYWYTQADGYYVKGAAACKVGKASNDHFVTGIYVDNGAGGDRYANTTLDVNINKSEQRDFTFVLTDAVTDPSVPSVSRICFQVTQEVFWGSDNHHTECDTLALGEPATQEPVGGEVYGPCTSLGGSPVTVALDVPKIRTFVEQNQPTSAYDRVTRQWVQEVTITVPAGATGTWYAHGVLTGQSATSVASILAVPGQYPPAGAGVSWTSTAGPNAGTVHTRGVSTTLLVPGQSATVAYPLGASMSQSIPKVEGSPGAVTGSPTKDAEVVGVSVKNLGSLTKTNSHRGYDGRTITGSGPGAYGGYDLGIVDAPRCVFYYGSVLVSHPLGADPLPPSAPPATPEPDVTPGGPDAPLSPDADEPDSPGVEGDEDEGCGDFSLFDPTSWAAGGICVLVKAVLGLIEAVGQLVELVTGLVAALIDGLMGLFKALFIPDGDFLAEQIEGVKDAWSDSTIGNYLGAFTGLMPSAPAGGCAGPHVSFPVMGKEFSADPLNACSGAMATTAGIVRTVLTATIVVYGGLACLRVLGGGFGWSPKVGGES